MRIFKACYGAEHILKHREYLVNAVSNGRPSGGAWYDSIVELMDERQAYGSLIFDSGATDGATIPNRYSIACKQFNAFRHNPSLISNRQWFWLRTVASAGCFANVNNNANSNYNNASNSGGGVRPIHLLCNFGQVSAHSQEKERESFRETDK